MNLHPLKIILITLVIACVVPAAYAQFDDVYYNPDNYAPRRNAITTNASYIDNDAYASYYDDYDFYYSSRIKRFYQPSFGSGFGFYDPYFVDTHYYDPYYSSTDYYYPGASIYYSYGSSGCGGNSSYYPSNHWGSSPHIQSFADNIWYAPSSNHWGISDGCSSYADYYNNYFNFGPSPVTNYYGITNVHIVNINNTGGRGTYYGPRIVGTSGTSPRGPILNHQPVQPVYASNNADLTQNNGTPKESDPVLNPIRSNTPSSVQPGIVLAPEVVSNNNNAENPKGVGKDIPVDVELKKSERRPGSNRPVFKPDTERFDQPSADRPNSNPSAPTSGKGSTRTSQDHSGVSPEKGSTRPSFQPSSGEVAERPRYTPPQRSHEPSSSSQGGGDSRNTDKPDYSKPLERIFDSGSRSNDSGRSHDKPSYSPPSRDNSSGGSSRSSDSGRSSSPSSSSGGSSSPRGRG